MNHYQWSAIVGDLVATSKDGPGDGLHGRSWYLENGILRIICRSRRCFHFWHREKTWKTSLWDEDNMNYVLVLCDFSRFIFWSTHGACWSGKHQKKRGWSSINFQKKLYGVVCCSSFEGLPWITIMGWMCEMISLWFSRFQIPSP